MVPRKLDQTDVDIIRELRKNGRASYREIAKKVDVSPGTVQNRINKLEENDIIKGYHAVVDWEELGYEISSIIGAKVKSSALSKIVEKLKKNPNVYGLYTVTGEFDLFIGVKYKSMQELDKFVKRDLATPEIESTTTFITLGTEKEARTFLEE